MIYGRAAGKVAVTLIVSRLWGWMLSEQVCEKKKETEYCTLEELRDSTQLGHYVGPPI